MDRRQRRRLDCDPVVRISHIFEYGACSAAAASAAPVAQVEHQYVFAYRYVPVPGMDAYDELGSRDFTVRECVAREAVILPVADLVQLRRNVPVPKWQWPVGWPEGGRGAGCLPEYIWCR